MTNPVMEVQKLGQSIWYDNIRRGLLTSGEFQRMVETGVSGVTSNPTIFEKAIAESADYDAALLSLARAGKSATEIYEALAVEDLRAAADALRPTYDRTKGADGFVSWEVDPRLAYDTERTVSEAKRLRAALAPGPSRGLARPNVLIKVPATPEGIPAIRTLIGDGVNVNVTLIFSLKMYQRVMEAYLSGLEDLASRKGDLSRIASVASFFVSRVDSLVDKQLEARIQKGEAGLKALLGKAAIANARVAYQLFKEAFGGSRFAALKAKGARVQRPLWASTSTKNPAFSDVLYVQELIGPSTVNTVPDATLKAWLDHGKPALTLEQGVGEARAALEALERAGVNMDAVTAQLLDEGVKAFATSFDKLLANIEQKRARLLAATS
ncbi:MAG: transaldolase [Chloroflexota bacterium]|nr:transaldolase [Chloroflexota bacterium]